MSRKFHRPRYPLVAHAIGAVLLALLALVAAPAGVLAAPQVVVSIRPVHSLVAAVMEGVGTPRALLPGGASPHTYALKPSDARALSRADVVFWIGPGLENFLARPLATLAGRARVVTLAEAPGLTLLPARQGGVWAEDGDIEHDHDHAGTDPHLWLDPVNASAMVAAAVAALAEADPPHADAYRANGARAAARLAELDRELAARLAPLGDRPFVVFHDAYRYLEHRYGLRAVGAVAVSPERPPGARRLGELRRRIAELGGACVFREPQFPPRLAEVLAEGAPVRPGVLDPIGADLPEGPDLYPALMRRNAAALVACLAGG